MSAIATPASPRGKLTGRACNAPGAVYPAHRHNKAEQCLVVEGDLLHDNHQYGPGDFTWAEPGSIDPQLSTRNGALLLIIGGRQTEFIET